MAFCKTLGKHESKQFVVLKQSVPACHEGDIPSLPFSVARILLVAQFADSQLLGLESFHLR